MAITGSSEANASFMGNTIPNELHFSLYSIESLISPEVSDDVNITGL